jgi:cell division protein FtsN
MPNRRSSSKKKKRRYTFEFTFSSLLLSSISLLFILAWVFSLGIMVGRGFLPTSIGVLSSIKERVTKDKEKKEIDYPRPIKEEELTFYNQLVDKKDEAKKNKKKMLATPLVADQDRPSKKTKIAQIKEDIRYHSVQVAALQDKMKTEKMVERLARLGYPAYYYETLINGKKYYRVRCGPFRSVGVARKCSKRLGDKEGFKPFIVYPRNKQ